MENGEVDDEELGDKATGGSCSDTVQRTGGCKTLTTHIHKKYPPTVYKPALLRFAPRQLLFSIAPSFVLFVQNPFANGQDGVTSSGRRN